METWQRFSAPPKLVQSNREIREESSDLVSSCIKPDDMSTMFGQSYGRSGTVTSINNIYDAQRFLQQEDASKRYGLCISQLPSILRSGRLHNDSSNGKTMLGTTQIFGKSGNMGPGTYNKDFNNTSYARPYMQLPVRDGCVLPQISRSYNHQKITNHNFIASRNSVSIISQKAEMDRAALSNADKFKGYPHTYGSMTDYHPNFCRSMTQTEYTKPSNCGRVITIQPSAVNHIKQPLESHPAEHLESEARRSYQDPREAKNSALINRYAAKQTQNDNSYSHFIFGSDNDFWTELKLKKALGTENRKVGVSLEKKVSFADTKKSERQRPLERLAFFRLQSVMQSDYIPPHIRCKE